MFTCEAHLQRLGVKYIDLYYVHRISTWVPIEETMEELKKLVEEGKVEYVDLLEASLDTISRAYAPRKSRTRNPDRTHESSATATSQMASSSSFESVLMLGKCLSSSLSPLGRGFFGGKGPNSLLGRYFPSFQLENLDQNKSIYAQIEKIAEKHNCIPPQLTLAWVLHQGNDIVPIPGQQNSQLISRHIALCQVENERRFCRNSEDRESGQEHRFLEIEAHGE
ncbi:hypothetical protein NL676_020305 [Syzygium grande]|nr:hypothetical protein NL676_020305 [Syzygium grande]